jgi:alkylation response protein AidB-like acyl-CoA dehydrogenase
VSTSRARERPTALAPPDAAATAADLGRFLDSELPGHQAEFGDRHDFAARMAWQRRMTEGGWTALVWPVEHGGRGLGVVARLECEMELARRGAPTIAGVMGVYNVGPTLIAHGTAAQRDHLRRILTGEEVWCQGFSEPDAGSDLAGLRSTAKVVDGGFVLTGHKVWTTNGMDATHCMVLARTDPAAAKHHGISALLVPLDRPGIERRPIEQMDGGAEFAELFFDEVAVPADALLGALHQGWQLTMTTLSFERAGVISQVGGLERDVGAAIARFGPTADPILRQELSQRYIEGRVLGLSGARALSHLAAGAAPGPEQALIRLGQGLLRQRLSETRVRAAGIAAVAGVDEDIGCEMLTSRSASIAAGTREILKNVVAERVLGLPR